MRYEQVVDSAAHHHGLLRISMTEQLSGVMQKT